MKVNISKLTVDLSTAWVGFLRDWGPPPARRPTTAQLGRYLAEHSPDPDADEAAEDPYVVTRARVEAFQARMIETRSASIALNKHKVPAAVLRVPARRGGHPVADGAGFRSRRHPASSSR